jgi:hypothetical protein
MTARYLSPEFLEEVGLDKDQVLTLKKGNKLRCILIQYEYQKKPKNDKLNFFLSPIPDKSKSLQQTIKACSQIGICNVSP